MTMASARALLPKATMCVGKAPKASDKALLDRRGGMEWFHEGVRTVPKFVFFCNLWEKSGHQDQLDVFNYFVLS